MGYYKRLLSEIAFLIFALIVGISVGVSLISFMAQVGQSTIIIKPLFVSIITITIEMQKTNLLFSLSVTRLVFLIITISHIILYFIIIQDTLADLSNIKRTKGKPIIITNL